MRLDSARLQPSARVVPQFDSSGLDPQKTKAFTVEVSSDGVKGKKCMYQYRNPLFRGGEGWGGVESAISTAIPYRLCGAFWHAWLAGCSTVKTYANWGSGTL